MDFQFDNIAFAGSCGTLDSAAVRWVTTFNIGAPIYGKVYSEGGPSVNARLIKRFGFDSTELSFQTIYFDVQKENIITLIKTHFAQLANKSFTVTVGDDEYLKCELNAKSTKMGHAIPMLTLSGISYRVNVSFSFDCNSAD